MTNNLGWFCGPYFLRWAQRVIYIELILQLRETCIWRILALSRLRTVASRIGFIEPIVSIIWTRQCWSFVFLRVNILQHRYTSSLMICLSEFSNSRMFNLTILLMMGKSWNISFLLITEQVVAWLIVANDMMICWDQPDWGLLEARQFMGNGRWTVF